MENSSRDGCSVLKAWPIAPAVASKPRALVGWAAIGRLRGGARRGVGRGFIATVPALAGWRSRTTVGVAVARRIVDAIADPRHDLLPLRLEAFCKVVDRGRSERPAILSRPDHARVRVARHEGFDEAQLCVEDRHGPAEDTFRDEHQDLATVFVSRRNGRRRLRLTGHEPVRFCPCKPARVVPGGKEFDPRGAQAAGAVGVQRRLRGGEQVTRPSGGFEGPAMCLVHELPSFRIRMCAGEDAGLRSFGGVRHEPGTAVGQVDRAAIGEAQAQRAGGIDNPDPCREAELLGALEGDRDQPRVPSRSST